MILDKLSLIGLLCVSCAEVNPAIEKVSGDKISPDAADVVVESQPLKDLKAPEPRESIERELCFIIIKQAFDADVTFFRLDDRKCLQYLPEFAESYREKISPR